MKAIKILKAVLTFLGIIILAILLLLGLSRLATYSKSRISKNGVEDSLYVELGGQKQFISIRGRNKNNPVVIFLHGGPGSPMTYAGYYYQDELEQKLTFVNWDQRGCGRTYYKNKKSVEGLSQARLSADLDELVDYCRKRFNQDKVIVMAHSNGTTFGLEYVKNHPEKVSQYIGIGQMVNARIGDFYAAEKALASMADSENKTKLKEALAKYRGQTSYEDFVLDDFITMRRLEAPYWKGEKESGFRDEFWSGFRSPYMNLTDVKWFTHMLNNENIFTIEEPLMKYTLYDFDVYEVCGTAFEVPIAFLGGYHDSSTPLKLVEEYFEQISAPDKKLFTFEDYGHMLFYDSPETFWQTIETLLF